MGRRSNCNSQKWRNLLLGYINWNRQSRRPCFISIAGASSIPTVSRITTVSFPDRHFITAGCQAYAVGGGGNVDDMLVRWSTQEDFTTFAPTSTNTSGDQRLEVGTKIVAVAIWP
jgi:hypothetical protein